VPDGSQDVRIREHELILAKRDVLEDQFMNFLKLSSKYGFSIKAGRGSVSVVLAENNVSFTHPDLAG